MAERDLVTNTEVQDYLDTSDNYESEIARASMIIRQMIGNPIRYEDFTEYHSGGYSSIFVHHYPVVSGSVTVKDTEDDTETSGFVVRGRRIMAKRGIWAVGNLRWEVTYQSGIAATVDDVPADIKKAVLLLIKDATTGAESGMKRETIGDYSYERFGGDQARGVMDDVERILAPRIRAVKSL